MKRTWSSGLSRKLPVNCVVMVEEPGFSTPRTDMHMCSASSMTATPRGFENLLDRGRDLRGHVLLRLQPARIDIDQPRQLGKPDHPVHRLVGDMRLAHERHHVMLAMGVEGDVAHQHEIVVACRSR